MTNHERDISASSRRMSAGIAERGWLALDALAAVSLLTYALPAMAQKGAEAVPASGLVPSAGPGRAGGAPVLVPQPCPEATNA